MLKVNQHGSIHENIECYSKDLAILNELKKEVPHMPGLPEGNIL